MLNSTWGFALWHMGCGLLGLAFLAGLVFFFVWAIKTLKKNTLLKWAIILLVIPAIGWILAVSLVGQTDWKNGDGFRMGPGMMWNIDGNIK